MGLSLLLAASVLKVLPSIMVHLHVLEGLRVTQEHFLLDWSWLCHLTEIVRRIVSYRHVLNSVVLLSGLRFQPKVVSIRGQDENVVLSVVIEECLGVGTDFPGHTFDNVGPN